MAVSSDLPEHFRWALRLFLSVDLSGSTAFKSRSVGQDVSPGWLRTLADFFTQFPDFLREAYPSSYASRPKPVPWKYVGDEIIFVVELTCHTDTVQHLVALLQAVNRYGIEQIRPKQPGLGIKASAWTAGFPVTNQAVELDGKPDYLGLSMDLGFRLSQLADERRIPLSAELARLVASARHDRKCDKQLPVGYSGRQPLRGVMEGRAYPVFWVDRKLGQSTEDALTGAPILCGNNTRMIEFLDEFFEENANFVVCPFIETCDKADFQAVPEWATRARESLMHEDPAYALRRSNEARSAGAPLNSTELIAKARKKLARKKSPKPR